VRPTATKADLAVDRLIRGMKAADDEGEGEPWAEDAVRLSLIEALATAGLLRHWRSLRDLVLRVLGLLVPSGDRFQFDPTQLPSLVAAGELMIRTVTAPTGPLTAAQVDAWRRGMINAAVNLSLRADEEPVASAIARALERQRAHYQARGLRYVRSGVARQFLQPIVAALSAGEFDGQNPVNVAVQLRRRFGRGEYNWQRLATSEVAWAQVEGKRELYIDQQIEKYDFVTADGPRVCPVCAGHAAGGPYLVSDDSAPLPMRDSHPGCRCTTLPVLPE
jgi:SPP1 gp7 family putative phage head morphogenesis protein